jgi:putative ABC transport system permease protein
MKMALRFLWRDWKGGELSLLIVSLIIAVTSVTSISIFADRVKRSIQDQAGELLAGDLQVRSSAPVSLEWREYATGAGLAVADVLSFQSMAISDNNMTIGSIKAVSDAYPLKGSLTIGKTPFVSDEVVQRGPAQGEVWLASRLFDSLGVAIGDRITIGAADFTVTAALIKEPDSTQSFFGVGPRVMMHWLDVPATEAVQVGSRLNYTWILAGDSGQVTDMTDWLTPQLDRNFRLSGIKTNDRSVGSILDRAESFLLLAGSLGVILAGVALALAAQRYSGRQADYVALLKTMGMTPQRIQKLYLTNLFVLTLVGTSLGLLLGWLLHQIIVTIFSGLLPDQLSPAGLRPYITGAFTGIISLFAFAAPPILALRDVPPARVISKNVVGGERSAMVVFLIGLAAMMLLVFWYSQSWLMTGALTGGLLLALVGVGGLAWVLLAVTRRVGDKMGRTWRIGLASLQRHSKQNAMQIMIFSTALMLLFIISLMRGSLISEWQRQLPVDAPNHFIYNIFEGDLPQVQAFMTENQVVGTPLYPMVRGRLMEINGVPLAARPHDKDNVGGDDFHRELNLTWSDTMAADNQLMSGQWWQPSDADVSRVSVEQSFAEALGLQLEDQLVFSIGGLRAETTIASIRSVEWESMRPNFYVIFNDRILDGSSASYMTSFQLPLSQKSALTALIKAVPTVSLIEVDAMIDQLRSIIGQVSLAIEFILALVLAAGLLVLVASVQASLDARLRESAILRTLGAQQSLVRGSLMIEFGTLGWLSGLLGVIGAESVLYFLQVQVFDMAFQFNGMLWLVGPWVGAVLIAAVGMISTRRVVKVPPLLVLRGL